MKRSFHVSYLASSSSRFFVEIKNFKFRDDSPFSELSFSPSRDVEKYAIPFFSFRLLSVRNENNREREKRWKKEQKNSKTTVYYEATVTCRLPFSVGQSSHFRKPQTATQIRKQNKKKKKKKKIPTLAARKKKKRKKECNDPRARRIN